MHMRRKFIVGIGLGVVAVAAVSYSLLREGSVPNVSVHTPPLATDSRRVVPDGLREYRNTAYEFSLLYPQELKVEEYIEGGNAITITFQDATNKKVFQVFIVPYQEEQISDERFTRDIPSGVRTNLENITIDGATGAAFYSESTTLGETHEIWFIHDSFLFEVTTLKPLDTWLATIMQTWQFL